MTPEMQSRLVSLSTFYDTEPGVVFRRVLEVISEQYGTTMAMINLLQEDRIKFRDVVNPHPLWRRYRSIELSFSYCQFTTGTLQPILIQNAAADPRYQDHPAVRLGLTRYLGVPVCTPGGEALGTLCFLDSRSEEPLGEDDVEFLSLLAMRVNAELERERAIDSRLATERAAAERLAAANSQLRSAAEARQRLLTAVVHDFRQPLTTFRALHHVLLVEEDPQQRRECLELFEQQLAGLDEMIEELATYAQADVGAIPAQEEQIEIASFISRCVDSARPEAELRHVSLQVEVVDGIATCVTDPVKLSHIVRNLVGNAVKFTACKTAEAACMPPTVFVRVAADGPLTWCLEVEDNGIGMSKATLEQIFLEFYQGPEARQCELRSGYAPSLGLGLAIVRHFCTALGGRIEVESGPGTGTRFNLVFPRMPLQA